MDPVRYVAREIGQIENPPRDGFTTWNSIRVGVFAVQDGVEHQVGETQQSVVRPPSSVFRPSSINIQ